MRKLSKIMAMTTDKRHLFHRHRVYAQFLIESVYLLFGLLLSSSCTFPNIDAPRCKPGTEQSSVGSINMHSIDVRCEVEADPAEPIRFSWTYNNTRNVSPVCIYHVLIVNIFDFTQQRYYSLASIHICLDNTNSTYHII